LLTSAVSLMGRPFVRKNSLDWFCMLLTSAVSWVREGGDGCRGSLSIDAKVCVIVSSITARRGGSVEEGEVEFTMLHHKGGFCLRWSDVGGKLTVNSTWGLLLYNRSVYILMPLFCSHPSSACTMWSSTAVSALHCHLISAITRLHSFPVKVARSS
jgi:hypothetical protein